MQLIAVRQRSCPACARPVMTRSARWCGSCGAPLRPAADSDPASDTDLPDADPSPTTGDGRRRVAMTALTVAVVAGVLVAGGPVVDRLPGDDTAVEDLEVAAPSARALQRVTTRFQPPPPPLTDPVCLRAAALDCFRWTVADADVGRSHVQVAGELVLSTSFENSDVTARRLTDGAVVWRAPLDAGGTAHQVVTTDRLLLTVESGVLTARDLLNGQVRWRTDDLAPDEVTFLAAGQRGPLLVLLAFLDAPVRDDGTVIEPTATAIGLDADDGRTGWRREAAGPAGIAPDATVAFVDATGDLIALEPDGRERWRVPAVPPGAPGGTWIHADVVTVWDNETGGDRMFRLEDGRPLGVGGTVLASDDERTFLEVWPGQRAGVDGDDVDGDDVGGDDEQGPTYALLDGDGDITWQVAADPTGCTLGARFEEELVRVAGCGGSELVLDVADGHVRSRTPPVEVSDSYAVTFAERLGPYTLQPQAPSEATSAYLLLDTLAETEVARLPPDSTALTRQSDAAWDHDLGGIAVVQHRGGLVAIDLPSGATGHTRGR